jgi:hypothetical protein
MSRALDANMTIYDRYIYKYWDIILLVFIIALVALLRSGLLSVPLERDEGEYAYTAQLILQGIPPYAEAYSMKMPGIYVIYAILLTLFGKTHTGIHLGLLVVNGATIVLLFLLARYVFDPVAAVVTAATFAVLSLNQSVQGVFANAEHFVLLPAVAATLLLQRALTRGRPRLFFWSGLLFGIAFMIKQHGVAFIGFGSVYLLIVELRRRPIVWQQFIVRCSLFVTGVFLPFGLACLFFLLLGVFGKFWFWTFVYAQEYISAVPFSIGMQILMMKLSKIVFPSVLLFLLAGISLIILLSSKNYRSQILFVILFTLFSWLAVCPGLHFRPHYFVLFLPAIALLTGISVSFLSQFLKNHSFITMQKLIPVFLVVISLLHSLYYQRDYLFKFSPTLLSHHIYGSNPFPESLEIGRYIQNNSSENDRIAILGSEPQIYFYANRRAATSYLYTYPLMEPHPYAKKMQSEMIEQIESNRPEFLVVVNIRTSWLARPTSEKMIFLWMENYVRRHYETVGVVDILSRENTVSYWGDESLNYSPHSKAWLLLFRRKSRASFRDFSGEKGELGPA